MFLAAPTIQITEQPSLPRVQQFYHRPYRSGMKTNNALPMVRRTYRVIVNGVCRDSRYSKRLARRSAAAFMEQWYMTEALFNGA